MRTDCRLAPEGRLKKKSRLFVTHAERCYNCGRKRFLAKIIWEMSRKGTSILYNSCMHNTLRPSYFSYLLRSGMRSCCRCWKLARLKAGGLEVAMSSDSSEDERGVHVRALIKPSP